MSQSVVTKGYLIKSFSWVVLAYLLALAAAFVTILVLVDFNTIIKTFIADIAATLVIFAFGRIFRNASFYDPFWSLAPIFIVFYWLIFINSSREISWNQLLPPALVIIWGLRLTFNWASQWQGQKHEDWRYMEYRRSTGRMFWLIELVGIELSPTVVVFLGCLSLYPVLTAGQLSFGPFQMAATVVTLGAIVIETTADAQLKVFLGRKPPPGSILQSGLWKYSRHPNYLGEILFWWGLWLFVPDYAWHNWLTVIGPLAVTGLFLFISIPLMDKHNLARRPGYAEHARKVSALIPWFPRK
jgi:steroid 5-alpha reductase family enzyme